MIESKKVKILVVDDDELIRGSLEAILESKGYQISVASTGLMAKEMINQEFFNLILLDINLPDISGLELCKYIRDTKPIIRTILLTGYGLQNAGSFENNANEYIVKPFDIIKLMGIISRHLEEQKIEFRETGDRNFGFLDRGYKVPLHK